MENELDRKCKEIVAMEYLSDNPEEKEWSDLYDEVMDIGYEYEEQPAGDIIYAVKGLILWVPFHELSLGTVLSSMEALHGCIYRTFEEAYA